LPRVYRVEPSAAKPDSIVTAFGVNLDRSHVLELMLNSVDSDSCALTHILEQGEDQIRFRIPKSPTAGRYSIVLMVTGHLEPELIDQQVFITILRAEGE